MADRDMTPVRVTLDRARPYRANDKDRVAVTVGPGEVEVPTWVAQEWKLIAFDEARGLFDQRQDDATNDGEQPDDGLSDADRAQDEQNDALAAFMASYDDLNVAEVLDGLDWLTPEQREQVRQYEAANKNRRGVMAAFEPQPGN